MRTFAFLWNPETKTPDRLMAWDEFDADRRTVQKLGMVRRHWTCTRGDMRAGDRFFLSKGGDTNKGLIGSGWVLAPRGHGRCWLQFTGLVAFDKGIRREDLLGLSPEANSFFGSLRASGQEIPASVVELVEKTWAYVVRVEPALAQFEQAPLPVEPANNTVVVRR
jgi:hypothetical protein